MVNQSRKGKAVAVFIIVAGNILLLFHYAWRDEMQSNHQKQEESSGEGKAPKLLCLFIMILLLDVCVVTYSVLIYK